MVRKEGGFLTFQGSTAYFILLILILTVVVYNPEDEARGEDIITEKDFEMGTWRSYDKHPNDLYPGQPRCRMMYREDPDELVFFQYIWGQGVQVWSYFVDNQTWIHWNSTGPTIDHEISHSSFVSDTDSSRAFFFGGYDGIGGKHYFSEVHIFYYNNKTWVKVDDPEGPIKRYGSSMTYDISTDSIWIFGGRVDLGSFPRPFTNEIWQFNITNGWKQHNTTGTEPKERAFSSMTMGARYDRFYIALGSDRYDQFKDLWYWNINDSNWTLVQDDLDLPQELAPLMCFRNESKDLLLLMGAVGDTYGPYPINLTFSLSTNGQGIKQLLLPPEIPPMTMLCSDTNENGTRVICAGGQGGMEFWSVDLDSLEARSLNGSVFWSEKRSFTGYDPDDGGKLYVLEQYTEGDGERTPIYRRWNYAYYSIEDKKWHSEILDPSSGPDNSSGMAGAFDPNKDRFYLFGGGHEVDGPGGDRYEAWDGLWSLDLETNKWTLIMNETLPGPRGSSEMVFDHVHDHIYVAGGINETQIPNGTLYRYDISSGNWSNVINGPDYLFYPASRMVMDPSGKGMYLYSSIHELCYFHFSNNTWESLCDVYTGFYQEDPGIAVNEHTSEVMVFLLGNPHEVIAWRGGWKECKTVWEGLGPWPVEYQGLVYNKGTRTFWSWSVGSLEVNEFNPVLRTPVKSIEIMDNSGMPVDEVFAYRGAHTLRVNGSVDGNIQDLKGFLLNFTWGNNDASILINEWGERPVIYGILPFEIPFMTVDLELPDHGNEWYFEIPFDLKTYTPDNIAFDILASPIVSNGTADPMLVRGAFTTYTALRLTGYHFSIQGRGNVSEGDWVYAGWELITSNMTLEYTSRPGSHPFNGTVRIYISNGKNYESMWDYVVGEIGNLSVKIEGKEGERIEISLIIADKNNNELSRNTHYFFVDETPPRKLSVKVHSDSYYDEGEYDNDHEVFVTFNDVKDEGSGLAGYFYSLDHYFPYNNDNLTQGNFTLSIFEPGQHTIWVWAVDNIGLMGSPDWDIIIIDTTPVEFFYPNLDPDNEYEIVGNRIELGIGITDDISGVAPRKIEYRQTGEDGTYSDWKPAYHTSIENNLTKYIEIDLVYGLVNRVQFRANDMSDNGFIYSKEFSIFPVDMGNLSLELITPRDGSYAYRYARLHWKVTSPSIRSYSQKIHLISPGGSDHVQEAVDSMIGVNIDKEGTWKWFVEISVNNSYVFSSVWSIRAIFPTLEVTLPRNVTICNGTNIEIPVSFRNRLDAQLVIEISHDAIDDLLPPGIGSYYLDPNLNSTFYFQLETEDLKVGTYTITFNIWDNFDRNATTDMIIEVQPREDELPDTPPDQDSRSMLLYVFLALAILALLTLAGMFLYYHKAKGHECDEE